MTEPTTPCVRGCRKGGAHVEDCPGGACTGCAPRRATHGLLCDPCTTRLHGMLAGDNSALVADQRLTSELGQHVAGIAYDSTGGGTPVDERSPLQVARYDARQELRDTLHAWLEALCARHDLSGPSRFTVRSAAGYLESWLDRIVEWPDVAELWDQLAWAISQAHALAPWRADVRRCDGVPCPDCGAQALVVYSGEAHVTCRACGALTHRDVYLEHVARVARDLREGVDGHTLAELAAALALPVATIRSWAQRGRLEPVGRRGNARTYSLAQARDLKESA